MLTSVCTSRMHVLVQTGRPGGSLKYYLYSSESRTGAYVLIEMVIERSVEGVRAKVQLRCTNAQLLRPLEVLFKEGMKTVFV